MRPTQATSAGRRPASSSQVTKLISTSAAAMRHRTLRLLAVALALALCTSPGGHSYQQPSESVAAQHAAEAASAAAAADQAAGSMALAESAGALAAADDLIAAESSQTPDNSAAEHKSFTRQQEQLASSVAPNLNMVVPPQQQQQQQQQPAPVQYMPMGARMQPQPNKAAANFNQFMAAALAGNYGPAQQQMAAAQLHAQHHAPHPQMGHRPPPHAANFPHGPAQIHHQPQLRHQPQQMHPQQQQQQQQMQQSQPQHQLHHQPGQLAVQESSVRHNVVAVPPPAQANIQPQPAHHQPPALDSNTIDVLSDAPQQAAAAPQQQQQPQMAAAQSAQHPVIAQAVGSSSSALVGGGQEAWPLQAPDVPKIVNLEVKCEKNLMKVSVEFDKIFNGVIFSKGHFSQGQCIHVGPQSNKQQAYFDISINSCGTQGNTQNGLYGMGGNTGSGTYFENTIVIQYDPNVQEVYDHARKLRCTWHDQYEKAVTFRPFPVDMLDIVRADFAGDNVGCWMQIQVGKGPWASEVAGIVKIGQTMTMVLAIKDEENKFDMLVRNCFAHDGKRGPIELVDKSGCITRPKLMSRFTKIKNFGSSATVLSYAHFQAFKFPDSMEVHFQCTIQICRHQCPDQCANSPNAGLLAAAGATGSPTSPVGGEYSESTIQGTFNINGQSSPGAQGGADSMHLRKFGTQLNRERRDVSSRSNGSHKPQTQSVGVNRVIQVVSSGDLAFAIQQQQQQASNVTAAADPEAEAQTSQMMRVDLGANQICMSSYNFVLALVMLVLILLCSCMLAISFYVRQRSLLAASGGKKLHYKQHLHSPTSSASSTLSHNSHYHHHHHQQHHVPSQQQQMMSHGQMFSGLQ